MEWVWGGRSGSVKKKTVLREKFDITALTFDQLSMFIEKADESRAVNSDALKRLVEMSGASIDGKIHFLKFVAYLASLTK